MIIPFIPQDLLAVNEELYIMIEDDVIIVDNFYRNYDQLYEVCQNMPVPRWKWHEKGKNFVDYYDCRPSLLSTGVIDKHGMQVVQVINHLIKSGFNEQKDFILKNDLFEFNYYKNIKKNIPNSQQHFPHKDDAYNAVIHLDKICSGGTAFYQIDSNLDNDEHLNLLHDISHLEFKIIESKPNRLMLFNGNRYHGGYIDQHNLYIDNWRINQVMFFGIDK